jgi:hypothetical protein
MTTGLVPARKPGKRRRLHVAGRNKDEEIVGDDNKDLK